MRGRDGGSPHSVWLLGVLLSAMTVCTLMQFVLAVLAPFITAEFDLSRTRYGSAASVLFLGAVVVSLLAGRLVDRFGAVVLLRALYAAAVGAFVLLAVTPGWAGVMLAALIMGVPLGLGNPVTNVVVVHRVPAALRGTATGLKQAGVQVGALLVGLTLPTVAAAYGWRAAGGLLAVVAAAGLAVALPLRGPLGARGAERSARRPRLSVPHPALTVYAVLAGVAASAVNAFLPLFAFEELGMPAQRAGVIVALLGLLGATSRVTVGVLGDRLPRFWLWLAGLAFAGAAATLALIPAMDRPGLVWAAVAGFGATAPGWQSAAMLGLMRDGDRDGRSAGVVIGGFLLGMVAGPLAFGRLTDHTGSYAAGWCLVAAALLVSGVLAAVSAVRTRA
ncbi:MFS transporter [Jiangella mangrovi]|uniref:MFS family permease n=1 Tax=Jiangella mangrovi TaxID=1524084 RepID=A0A7W9LMD8_9ACTN|nr:MFS transporter [Jiangella mangrovi]MBB5788997.1 MFS family permease [Jiangella mangrovi]